MKWILLPILPLVAGCEALSASVAENTPAIMDVATKAVDSAASGDWSNTEIAGTGVLGTIVLGTLGKWLHGRMKTSGPGEIIGGKSA